MTSPEVLDWVSTVFPGSRLPAGREARTIPGAGSDRRLSRVPVDGGSVILVENPLPAGEGPGENDSFVYLSGHLRTVGLPVPQVFAYHRGMGVYLMEDLGDVDLLAAAGEETRRDLYLEAVSLLARMQVDAREGFDPSRCHSPPRYDRDLMLRHESGYFQRECLEGLLGLAPPTAGLAGEYARLADRAAGAGAEFFLHRDFQSTNLKVHRGGLWIIDFQGARFGPPQYDLASLLYDPYGDLPGTLREELLEEYLGTFLRRSAMKRRDFLAPFPFVCAHRLMQALGAFCFLGLRRGKKPFLEFVPAGLRILSGVLETMPAGEAPALRKAVALAGEKAGSGR